MEKEQQDLIKKIDSLVLVVKKDVIYTDSLKNIVKNSGFETINQDDFYDRVKDCASKKSNLVELLSNEDNFKLWKDNTSEKNKNFLYDLAKNDKLKVDAVENKGFVTKDAIKYSAYRRPVFNLNENYTQEKADDISQKVKNLFSLEGEKHLSLQEEAKKVVSELKKDFQFQVVSQMLVEKVGDKWDDVLSAFKRATKDRELEKADDGFILTTNALGKEQKFKFSVDDKNHITKISPVPPNMEFIINKMRHNDNVTHPKMKLD